MLITVTLCFRAIEIDHTPPTLKGSVELGRTDQLFGQEFHQHSVTQSRSLYVSSCCHVRNTGPSVDTETPEPDRSRIIIFSNKVSSSSSVPHRHGGTI